MKRDIYAEASADVQRAIKLAKSMGFSNKIVEKESCEFCEGEGEYPVADGPDDYEMRKCFCMKDTEANDQD